mmetsp:Transcript_18894/g.28740  ORF Transcript_18894/g.28740 Transcript_18894/m.28740 type:complete len:243 (-) Transcript_18894:1972-2700(-)
MMHFNMLAFAKSRIFPYFSSTRLDCRNCFTALKTSIENMDHRISSLFVATLLATFQSVFSLETVDCVEAQPKPQSKPAFVLEGVELAHNIEIDEFTLSRNGEGIRMINFLGFEYKVYVASFWTVDELKSIEDILACDKPKRMDFTFLKSFGKSKVSKAWSLQLDDSVSYKYDSWAEDRAAFIEFFGDIAQGGTQTVIMIGDETIVIDQGVEKGKIIGKDFQKAFLSMWFGEKPVTSQNPKNC